MTETYPCKNEGVCCMKRLIDLFQTGPSVVRSVVSAHWPPVLENLDSIPAGGEENLVSEHASLVSFAGMT